MSEEAANGAIQAVASNPKVAGAMTVIMNALGAVALLDKLQTVLGLISLGIGCAIGLYALKCNITKSKIYERMLRDGESLKE